MSASAQAALDRLMAKVEKTETCWLWTSCVDRGGYGQFWLDGRCVKAHRVAYTLLIGPIPDAKVLDHLCRVRKCVNPLHLEPVTLGENTLRGQTLQAVNAAKTHCIRGHLFDEQNTRYGLSRGRVRRECRACQRIRRSVQRSLA